MTWDEFKAALKGLGLSQRQFSFLVRSSAPQAISKWRLERGVPGYAAALIETLQAMQAHDPEWARGAIAALVDKAIGAHQPIAPADEDRAAL